MELRVLVYAPRGRDAAIVSKVLSPLHGTHVAGSAAALLAALEENAAAAVLTEETLAESVAAGESLAWALARWLELQPSWSDFPFIVLATQQAGRRPMHAVETLRSLGNVMLLERPLNAETLASAVEAAVRARRRQYATRQNLAEIHRTQAEVHRLNAELEARIENRTRELASANDRLVKEISEREKAQAALTQGQKLEAIGRLTGGIAHDFNNLLHVVNMNLELVSMYAKDEKIKPVVLRAKSAAKRGSKLTAQLLSFARSQSLLPRLIRVNELLLNVRDLLEISAGSGVEVRFELTGLPAMIVADPGQLEMAVLNLAVNSRDAMPSGGALTVSTEMRIRGERDLKPGAIEGSIDALPPGEYVILRVTDTGEGIPAHLMAKVFDPFFTTKPVGSGTGLGLSQVYGFTRQSGGAASIRSEPGNGTIVEMHFPLAPEDTPATSEPPMVDTSPPPPGRARHILVVEDDAEVRRVIVECLSLIGYAVTEAANGCEAIAALERHRPDLLMVDYAMPDMTGAEVIVRAREIAGDLPVIMATGYADMAAVERLAGRPRILRKPFDMSTLGAAVADVLGSAESVREPVAAAA